MRIFTKDSLESLRQKIDLVEVLSAHIELKRSGASYKGLCPFHDEKTPSFLIHKGDTHYHCFGCGAHGDAIQFLMGYLKMSFADAVESLAERFQVLLQHEESVNESMGPNKAQLKEALDTASRFFHLCLLHTAEGHEALRYLYQRGINLDMIYRFGIGLSPKETGLMRKVLHAKFISNEVMTDAGLLTHDQERGYRDFFSDRIMFPIHDSAGNVIGFSARKYKDATFGGKYINTSETSLFKKSRILFGLPYSRRRIAKERIAIIVEGQIDALRLISEGLNLTVAGQGTAFGEGHAKELLGLGVNSVYLALDSDKAGQQAAYKIGDIFQREGVEVRMVKLPSGQDPDSFVRTKGIEAFLSLMKNGQDYLTFCVEMLSKSTEEDSPAGKNELVATMTKQIRGWNHSVMIHESLRKLAHILNVPEALVGVGQEFVPNVYIKKSAIAGLQSINPDRIMESDVLRWIAFLCGFYPHFLPTACANLSVNDFHVPVCRKLFEAMLKWKSGHGSGDLLSLAISLDDPEVQQLMDELAAKKVKRENAEQEFSAAILKMLERNWMEKREALRTRILSGQCTDEEATNLLKNFDTLKQCAPKVIMVESVDDHGDQVQCSVYSGIGDADF